ncbi:MAG: hypothetical protein HQ541_11945 [Mariniphaga sp.]|nr:hypothetical protein [Mariniphaga sp.]
MKLLRITNYFLSIFLVVLLIACSGSGSKKSVEETIQDQPKEIPVNDESQALLDYLVELGNYVNSRNIPSLIKVSSVYEELEGNNLIIDLRDEETYYKGHIKGAVNVSFSDIPDYMSNTIKPFEYDRIIMVCYAGQIASYTTALLRLIGYGNVYAMRWGMSAWNKEFANDSWLAVISGEYEDKLETTIHEKAQINDFPKMNTGKTIGEEIMDERIKAIFEAGYRASMVTAKKVFESPEDYYIINYDRRDKYEAGHIPGAIRYKPNGTLGIKAEMQTIPADKDIVIYCGTGHNSGFVTAYLRLFGYNAKTIYYGNNSFMYDKMVEDKSILSWIPFSEAEIEDYPFVK